MRRLFLTPFILLLLTSCTSNNPDDNFDKMYKGSEGIEEINLDEDLSTNIDTMKFDQKALPEEGEEIVVMKTNNGTIKIRLFPKEAPKTVENFKGLIAKKYYDGIIFHRVIKDFMIQGGDPTGTGMGGESLWGGKFKDEFEGRGKNIKGALSMANAGPNTNGSQFFIVQAESTPWLDGKHTVFGQVFEGLDIVDEIADVEKGRGDKPVKDIVMEEVKVEKFSK